RELREGHLPASLIVGRRHARRQPVVHGDQIGTTVRVSERDGNRHLAAQRRIAGCVRIEDTHNQLSHVPLLRHARSLVYLFSAPSKTLAAGPEEAGFWPVISRPSVTT